MSEQDEPDHDQTGTTKRSTHTGTDLPLWLRAAIVGVLVVLLVTNVLLDVFRGDYEGQATSLMLGGIIGTTLGVDKLLRGRGEQ